MLREIKANNLSFYNLTSIKSYKSNNTYIGIDTKKVTSW